MTIDNEQLTIIVSLRDEFEIIFLICFRRKLLNCQLSTVNCQLSIVNLANPGLPFSFQKKYNTPISFAQPKLLRVRLR